MWSEAYVGVGGNEGDRLGNIKRALAMLGETEDLEVEKVSDIIETEPWGFFSENKFLNCVVRIRVAPEMTPIRLLALCKEIERSLGREEKVGTAEDGSRIYHSRTIDLDILFFGTERIATKSLTVPHPLMAERDFVMVPLWQVATKEIVAEFPEVFGAERRLKTGGK